VKRPRGAPTYRKREVRCPRPARHFPPPVGAAIVGGEATSFQSPVGATVWFRKNVRSRASPDRRFHYDP